MNATEFLQQTYTNYKLRGNLRLGQHAANELMKFRPDLAKAIIGTEKDPFYVDANLGAFEQFVLNNW